MVKFCITQGQRVQLKQLRAGEKFCFAAKAPGSDIYVKTNRVPPCSVGLVERSITPSDTTAWAEAKDTSITNCVVVARGR